MIGGGVDLGLRALSSQLDLLLRIGDNIGGGREEGDPGRLPSPSTAIVRPASLSPGDAGGTLGAEAAEAVQRTDETAAGGEATSAPMAPVERDEAIPSRSLLGLRAPADTRRDTADGKPAHLSPERSLTRLAPDRPGPDPRGDPASQLGTAPAGAREDGRQDAREESFRSIVTRLLTPAVPVPAELGAGAVANEPGDADASAERMADVGTGRTEAGSSETPSATTAGAGDKPKVSAPPAAAFAGFRPAPQAPSRSAPSGGAAAGRGAGSSAETPAIATAAPSSEADAMSPTLAFPRAMAAQQNAAPLPARAQAVVAGDTAAAVPERPASSLAAGSAMAPPADVEGGMASPAAVAGGGEPGNATGAPSVRLAEAGRTNPEGLRAVMVQLPSTAEAARPAGQPASVEGSAVSQEVADVATKARPSLGDRTGRAADDRPALPRGQHAEPATEIAAATGDGRANRLATVSDDDAPPVLFDRAMDFGELADMAFGFPAGAALDGRAATPSAGFGPAGLAEAAAGGQPERAGVIASFILNAAMIPGWPPPRPIVGVALTEFRQQWPEAAKLSKSDLELLVYLANLGFGRKQLRSMLKRIEDRRRRSRILLAIAGFMTNLTALAKAYENELARLASDAEDEARLRERSGRERLVLR